MNTKQSTPVAALLIGLIGAVLTYILGSLLGSPILTAAANAGVAIGTVAAVLSFVKAFVGTILAATVYFKLIAKRPFSVGMALLSSVLTAIVATVLAIALPLPAIASFVVYFVCNFAVAFIMLGTAKPAVTDANAATVNLNGAYTAATTCTPENVDALSAALLTAIKPSLKAPLTAVLCSNEELVITNNGSEYIIEGYVNSQNSYGAMIKTDFTAKAVCVGDLWTVTNVKIGVKNAQAYAKNFAINYIVISIFVALMGILGYFLLTMFVGY